MYTLFSLFLDPSPYMKIRHGINESNFDKVYFTSKI